MRRNDKAMAKATTVGDVETTTRRGRPRSAETTAAILASAYALMAEAGLTAATIDAIARHSSVSKVTIYKWWPSREALLIDAFLNQASLVLPLSGAGSPAVQLRRHAAAYAAALRGEFGRVQLAVISECIASKETTALYHHRKQKSNTQLTHPPKCQ